MQRIGFDRKIKLAWLEKYAYLCRYEEDAEKLRECMHKALAEECPRRASRVKNITVLQRIWTRVDPRHQSLRDEALDFLDAVKIPERLVLHWGMALLAYPFFQEIAVCCGRLLKLQDTFNRWQVKEKVISAWGARPTLERAVPRVLESMVDWGVLAAGEIGLSRAQSEISLSSESLRIWLLQVCLEIEGEGLPLERVASLPYLFPFRFAVSLAEVQQANRFFITRQGNNSIVIDIAHK